MSLTDKQIETIIESEDAKHVMRDATELEIARAIESAVREEPVIAGDERRHVICVCPDCLKEAEQEAVEIARLREANAELLGAMRMAVSYLPDNVFCSDMRELIAKHGGKEE